MTIVRVHNASPYPFARATHGSSGYDLAAHIPCEVLLAPGRRMRLGTGLYLEIEPGWEAQVRGRSGLALKDGIMVPLGTIDSDYRGEIGVILFNLGDREVMVRPGDRIAQLIFAPVTRPAIIQVDNVADLAPTGRGAAGFGSSGR